MSRLWRGGLWIEVSARPDEPVAFFWNGQIHTVTHITNHWRVHTGWWRFHIQRDYFKLMTQSAVLVIVYQDKTTDRWYLEQVFD